MRYVSHSFYMITRFDIYTYGIISVSVLNFMLFYALYKLQ